MAILALNRNVEVNSERRNCPSAKHPVDLVHLSRQTLGERSLEIEVLSIFRSQSKLYLDRLENAKTAEERRLAAHTILGSARGIGAWRVAECAEDVQNTRACQCDLTELKAAVKDANHYIAGLLN